MATATAKKLAIKYSDIVLKLTPREAETLYIVTQYIGGSPGSRRGDIDTIRAALVKAAPELIKPLFYPTYQKFLVNDTSGITFKDDKEVK